MNSDAFPSRLKKAIGDESVRAFAARAGMSDTVVRQYLAGKSEPTRTAIIAIARAAGCNIDWLVSGEGEIKPGDTDPASRGGYDSQALRTVVEAVEEYFQAEDLELDPPKKAELIITLYEMAVEEDLQVDRKNVIRLIKLAM